MSGRRRCAPGREQGVKGPDKRGREGGQDCTDGKGQVQGGRLEGVQILGKSG